ncbi:MAG: type II secretion system protein [Bacilli bacterium]|nr:type II secretion system protein [Bacilli bacterium]
MLNNKKGFTLIEILAAITILGILMGIAIVSVTKVIENGKKKHYTTAEANMVLAGQSYVQQNRAQLPKAIGQKKKIPMSMLIDKNYIQPIKDYSDNDCNMAESYIQVFKYSQNDYSYVSYLECPNYNSQENINDMTPEINASIEIDTDNSKANAKITITGNDKLMSYSYIIYRNSKEVKNTGSVAVNDFAESKSINFSLSEYTPGEIKLVVTATNTYGNTKTKTVTSNVPDTKKPKCVYLDTADQADKEWTSENRKITVGCDDGETGSGCTRETYTKTFKSTTDYDYITIEDEDGNKEKCRVSVFVDKTAPSCTDSGDSNKWTSGNRTINWGCSDSQSGCDASYSGGSTPFTTTTKTATIAAYTIKDNVGNTKTCPARTANVYVDKTAPSCTDSGDSTTWQKTNRTINWGCSDGTNQSGCDSDYDGGSTPFTTTTKTATISAYTIKDKVGNTTTCPARTANVYVDKTAPSCTNSGDSTSWTNGNRTIYWGCSDGTNQSGCNTSYSGGSTPFTSTTKTASIAAYTIKDNVGNSTTCDARTANVYVDKTAPTCTDSGDSTSWTSGNRTIYWGCSDGTNQSGCNTSYSGGSTPFTSTTKTSTIAAYTIKDAAGNTTTCAARTANVYVDKTAPTISSISNPTGGAATDTAFSLTLYGSDGHSGIGKWRYKYAASSTWTDYSSSNKSPFTTTAFSAVRNEDVYISVCDAVGNCSSPSTSKIYIVADLCASTTTTWSNTWGACTSSTGATCGAGTQTMSGTKYSTINTSHSCGSDSKSQACDLGSCTTPVNETKYSGCDSYYITTCTGDTCTYTEKNGRPETGTISYSAAVDTMSSSCNKNFCSANLNSTNGTYTYYSISNCTVSSFGVTAGNNCSKGSKTGSNTFTVNISSAPSTGKCPIWVETNEPYRIASGVIKYSGSWNTYYCGEDKFCPDSGCSRWCVSK